MTNEPSPKKRSGLKAALLLLFAAALAAGAALVGPSLGKTTGGLKDGYYTAQIKEYDQDGWREYLTIFVNDGAIATAELNAVNSSGMLRSWDQEYIRRGYLKYQINPNHFSRLYCGRLVSFQDPGGVLPAFRGRKSHEIFVKLAEAAMASSRAGRLEVAEIERPETQFPDDI